ncbi:hypothetical protein ACFWAR_00585 [Streptomyces sp. NPDC059917]|uniref:hypothetical protein n=1 Tax=Streptomyces sp. NPDC059917 TaxID=3347002 RepID=UPI003650E681
MPYSRPRPACPITLLIEEPVLSRPAGGAVVAGAQFHDWVDMADAGLVTLRGFSPITAMSPAGGLLSEITLARATLWVEDQGIPVYSSGTPAAWRRDLIQQATASALSPDGSRAAVSQAAHRWAPRSITTPWRSDLARCKSPAQLRAVGAWVRCTVRTAAVARRLTSCGWRTVHEEPPQAHLSLMQLTPAPVRDLEKTVCSEGVVRSVGRTRS